MYGASVMVILWFVLAVVAGAAFGHGSVKGYFALSNYLEKWRMRRELQALRSKFIDLWKKILSCVEMIHKRQRQAIEELKDNIDELNDEGILSQEFFIALNEILDLLLNMSDLRLGNPEATGGKKHEELNRKLIQACQKLRNLAGDGEGLEMEDIIAGLIRCSTQRPVQ